MNKHIIVEEKEISKLQRQKIFAYVASLLSQVIAFTLGWLLCANWYRITLLIEGKL